MLQNLYIRSKLAAILLVPLLAVIVLASMGIGSRVRAANKAARVQDAAEYAVTATGMVHALQQERTLSALYVGSGKTQGFSSLQSQWAQTDQAKVTFTKAARKLEDHLAAYDPQLASGLKNVVGELAGLDTQRQQMDQNAAITVAQTLTLYDKTIEDLLGVNSQVAVGSNNERLLRTVSAFVALSRLKNAVDLERAYLNAVLAAGKFDPAQQQYKLFSSYVEDETLWRTQFDNLATAGQRNLLDATVSGVSVEQADQLRDQALQQETGPLGISQQDWSATMGAKLDLLRQVESRLGGEVVATARDVKQSAQREALFGGTGLALVLLLTIGVSLLIARAMVRPLRELRRVANDVASERLPRVVERLAETQDVDKVALEAAPPLTIHAKDEIGQVAAAFNTVHQVAVRIATEQAALRKSIGDMFLNLARRSQGLIDRQLELIDELEKNEADPDALEDLFRLDHLATRMRRNAEDLIVLSGAEPARRWSQPVALVDVVRAALAEVEDYNRVELLSIDDVSVTGHAVSDVVHLLAELIENATSFSPPGTKVQVAGQPVSNGYVIEIEDRGLGMSDEELVEANERLANPPAVDFALSRMLGLYVVGKLAQRYSIRVQLRHSWYGGVTALVLLPPTLIIRPQVPEQPAAATLPQLPELPTPPSSNRRSPAPASEALPPVGDRRRPPGLSEQQAQLSPPPEPAGERSDAVQRRLAEAQPEPAPPLAGAEVGAADAGDGREHLPIFEQARSDWFETGPSSPHLPLRRHGMQQPSPLPPQPAHAGNGTGHGRGASNGTEAEAATGAAAEAAAPAGPEATGVALPPASPADPFAPPAPPRPFSRQPFTRPGSRPRPEGGPQPLRQPPLPAEPRPQAGPPAQPPAAAPPPPEPGPAVTLPPLRRPGPGDVTMPFPAPQRPVPTAPRPTGPETARPTGPTAPAPQPASLPTTKAGLPRRVPRANLAPGIVAAQARRGGSGWPVAPDPVGARSPDEVRSMLSSYRTGLERGRRMAAGSEATQRAGPGAASTERGGSTPKAARSDDDAAQ
jgi:HAMP domain-containing protein